MRATLAVVVLATLCPCLLAIERITAAPPEAASETAPPQMPPSAQEEDSIAAEKAECDGCCEKSCCAEKSGTGEAACCTEKACCESCTAAKQCSKGACDTPTALERIGLKLFWTLPITQAQPASIAPAALAQPCPSSPCAISACAGSPATIAASSSIVSELPIHACEACTEATKVYYSAIPAAVPSPFAKGSYSAPVLATQAYVATLPLQAPPAPVTQASAIEAAPQPASCPKCAAPAAPSPTPAEAMKATHGQVTQVLFNIDVIVDESGSMKEFESLESDMPFLTADSEIVLATFRILERQKLVRQVCNPKLVTTVGQPAKFQIGTETPQEGASPKFEGFAAELDARELGGGLALEFKFRDTTGGECYEVATSLLLAHGQTVVMKASHSRDKAKDADQRDEKPAVYVVLTPQVMK